MNVIQFPNPVVNMPGRSRKQEVTQPEVSHNKLVTGRVDFTCPRCAARSYMDVTGILLRHLDFYCMSCGVLHRMINPAFSIGAGNGLKK
jgi:hypothetical protein